VLRCLVFRGGGRARAREEEVVIGFMNADRDIGPGAEARVPAGKVILGRHLEIAAALEDKHGPVQCRGRGDRVVVPQVQPVRGGEAERQLGGGRTLTTSELCTQLPGVSKATVYRHIDVLAAAGILEIAGEQRVRGPLPADTIRHARNQPFSLSELVVRAGGSGNPVLGGTS